MTEIREPNFTLDLPGEWEPCVTVEPGTFVWRRSEGGDTVTVMLLAIKPMFTIADPKRLLDDYLHHRPKFEKGRDPELRQSDPVSREEGASCEGGWDAADVANGRRLRHRVVLVANLLADFRYEATGLDAAAFDDQADALLGSATVIPA